MPVANCIGTESSVEDARRDDSISSTPVPRTALVEGGTPGLPYTGNENGFSVTEYRADEHPSSEVGLCVGWQNPRSMHHDDEVGPKPANVDHECRMLGVTSRLLGSLSCSQTPPKQASPAPVAIPSAALYPRAGGTSNIQEVYPVPLRGSSLSRQLVQPRGQPATTRPHPRTRLAPPSGCSCGRQSPA
jgi:hypothetical protein